MPVIIIIILAILLVVITWSWHNLKGINAIKSIKYIVGLLILIFVITLIVFSISKSGIQYLNKEIEDIIQNSLVGIFTGINAMIVIPYIAKKISRLQQNEIKKEKFKKSVIIISIIITIVFIFECGYLKDVQKGILKIYNSSIENKQ